MTSVYGRMRNQLNCSAPILWNGRVRLGGSSALIFIIAFIASLLSGCHRPEAASTEVVVYTSVDEPVARPILDEFTRRTGISVLLKTDAEATKSVGIAATLEAEKDRPRADVWWGNEVFHTIRLARGGVLAAYASPAAKDIPVRYQDSQSRWAAVGLRARVIVVAQKTDAAVPKIAKLEDLADPRLKGRIAMADPAFGTTGGHVVALYAAWGEARAQRFFQSLRDNQIRLVGGNSVVADEVGKGSLLAGLTDNDDASAARRAGGLLQMILPDQQDGGTLLIPTTVALIADAPHNEAARRLIDYLLSPEVEKRLVDADYAIAAVRDPTPAVKAMDVDYEKAADLLPKVVPNVRAMLKE